MRRLYWFVSPALLWLLTPCPLSAAEPPETKQVLVLYSEDKTHPGHEMTEKGIWEHFRSNKRFDVQLYSEYMDVSRFGDPSYAQAIADFLRRKYTGIKIDVIIAVYPYALGFLLTQSPALFPDVPVVAAAIAKSHVEKVQHSPARRFVTGTFVGGKVTDAMDAALHMRPSAKRIALIAGTAAQDTHVEQDFRSNFRRYEGKIGLIDLTRLPMEETLSRVASLSPDTFVVYLSIFRDGAGRCFVPREALQLVAGASKVPVFSFADSYLGFGIVGGMLMSFKEHGREAAEMALRIMGGESPASIPFGGAEAYVSAYDWRELKRWGIGEGTLPPGSKVAFKPPSLWEEHRGKILAGLVFMAIETLLIIGLFVNLRKRRRAEAEIAASALRYRTVADYTHDWEYWSAPDGSLNYVSPSCERITGYSVQELMKDPSLFVRIIVPEDRNIWDRHAHVDRPRLKPQEIQFRIRTKGGETRWIHHTCLPVNDGQGKFLGVRASNRDVTDRKRAEFEAQRQRNELAHVTRVAAMGELSSTLAHELNQPLAAIRNFANAAQRFLSQSEPNLTKVREALEGIVRDDKRAAEVIGGVRELLKKKEPSFGPVHINRIIQETLRFVRSDSVLEGVSIETELAQALPFVIGDRVQLQQVLLNLILNAIDAMTEAKADSRRLLIKTENERDGGVKVSVKDFGAGIDETHREKLFEPFHTTKPGGMGMGLAISARIILAHGGAIQGENDPQGGATFSFTLPASSESERAQGN